MCGIVGLVHHGAPSPVAREVFCRLVGGVAHRGPDGSGVVYGRDFTFGHTRLNVIDLSEAAGQPMSDAGGRVVITYNGEVYNFRELRAELAELGHAFRTRSDTEVVLEACKEWGPAAVEHLRGMFAFGLFDQASRTFLLARDPLGVKPVYWAIVGGSLAFCSELKGIVGLPGFHRRLDPVAVSSFLSYRYPLGDRTYYEGVHQLEAGQYLLLGPDGQLRRHRYWRAPVEGDGPVRPPGKREIRSLVEDAVASQTVADVPLGAYLSGGLDSSILVHELARRSGAPLRTFTVSFAEAGHDESEYATLVASRLGTDHRTVPVTRDDCLEGWGPLLDTKDQPLGMHNEVALCLLAAEARRHVTVVQAGEGADELFGGYARIFRTPFEHRRLRLSGVLPRPAGRRLRRRLGLEDGDPAGSWLDLFLARYGYLTRQEKAFLFTDEMRRETDDDDALTSYIRDQYRLVERRRPDTALAFLFVRVHLPGLLLMMDATSMANGLEARVPYTDHLLVEAALRMPADWRLRWRSPWHRALALLRTVGAFSERADVSKAVLKELYGAELPAQVVLRTKLGFPVPLDEWFRTAWAGLVERDLLGPRALCHAWLDRRRLRAWVERTRERPGADYGRKVWLLLNLEYWLRRQFGTPAGAAP